MTSTRTDIHKPSLADPADYRFMAAFYQGSSEAMMRSYKHDMVEYEAALDNYETFKGNHDAKTTCDHCGAAFAHGALFLHTPTQELVHIGHICATNTIGLPSKAVAARKRAERAAAEANERRKQQEATQGWRDSNSDIVDFLNLVAADEVTYRETGKRIFSNPFLSDMIHSLNRYGSLTERQAAATRKFFASRERFIQNQERNATEAAAITAEFPAGRQTVTGEVVSTKMQDSIYGSTLKMLVKLADGNKLWGTVPSSLEDACYDQATGETSDLRGATVTFTATFEVSRDDEHFGFFKRPTKASVASAEVSA